MPKDIALSEPELAQEWIFVPKPANVDAMSENLSYRRSRAEMNRSEVAPKRSRKRARLALGILIGAGVPYLIAAVQHGLLLGTDGANLSGYILVIIFGAFLGGLVAAKGTPIRVDEDILDDRMDYWDRVLRHGIYSDHSNDVKDIR